MIDLTETITMAQIATGIAIIAFVLVFHVFSKDVDRVREALKKKKS